MMSRSSSEVIRVLADAVDALSGRIQAADGRLLGQLAGEGGLHPEALAKTLSGWTRTLTTEAMSALVASGKRRLCRGRLTTLAPGNVPVVAPECVILGLLAGVPHQLLLSRRATALVTALVGEILTRRPAWAERIQLAVWRHTDGQARRQILERAERFVVFGSADTVDWVAERVADDCVLVPHGPSLAATYLASPEDLDEGELQTLLCDLARDVAHFDQRGCRSPHGLIVRGSSAQLERVERVLCRVALPRAQRELPRGELSAGEATTVYLDRLTSRSLGRVVEGPAWTVTIEEKPAAFRPSPLGRTIRLLGVEDVAGAQALLATLPAPIGVLATPNGRPPDGLTLPEEVEVAAVGALQHPRFDRLHDGRHRIDELLPPE